MGYHILYFDGKTSRTREASLTSNSINWKISFTNDFGTEEIINWDISKIKRSEVYTKGLVTFTYGKQFPFQRIESSDLNFIEYVKQNKNENINSPLNTNLHKSARKSIVFLLGGIVALSVIVYFFVIPSVANSFASTVSNKNVVAFGDYVFRVLSVDLDIDEDKSEKLQNFVNEMNTEGVFPLKLYVAKSEQMNAFALSGGKIVVFSSLLDKLENENQLAALIGHEITHIENRHVLKNISRNLSGALFVSILFSDINGITGIITENAHLFSQLSFSRKLEKEADIYGLEIMKKNNLDLNGMPELFSILKKETNIDMPSYLSNHPMLKERIEYTKEIAENQKIFRENEDLKEKWEILKNSLQENE